MTRRDFLASAAAFAAVPAFAKKPDEIRGVLLHWGHNMWGESLPEGVKKIKNGRLANDHLKFDDALWQKCVDRMVLRKMNLVVIDLGEFPVYPSHPELAVKGSRSPDWVLSEVRRLKKLGLEPIPKLNFSTAHDAWLKDFGRMVTTKPYYQACRDLIRDTKEMFDNPRYLHIGYDEERISHQKGFQCIRTDEVWWHDFLWFVKTVEDFGMRPWMWSDYGWKHDDFVTKCPKSVIHNNWYYDEWMEGFDLSKMKPNAKSRPLVELFIKLDKAGFDQVPCASPWCSPDRKKAGLKNDRCMADMVKFCRENLNPNLLKGFLMAPWAGDFDEKLFIKKNFNGIDQLAEALS